LRALPPRVASFQWRARRVARREHDEFSLNSATRPDKLAHIIVQARGCRHVAELGTGTGWTSISLLLADPERQLVTYDSHDRIQRERYLELAGHGVRERLTFIHAPGVAGPTDDQRFDLLFIDSSHALADTLEEFKIWRHALTDGGVVIFDDFEHRDYPGVRDAIQQLGLNGHSTTGLFVHRVLAAAPSIDRAETAE
jgi:predicted O-methyltransferase YrrM